MSSDRPSDAEAAEAIASVGEAESVLPDSISLSALTDEAEEPSSIEEPLYRREAREDIQGNIVPGFNKDHQHFLFYRLGPRAQAKAWLRRLAPAVASMDDVLAFVRIHRSMRLRFGSKETGLLKSTWVNVALSHVAIAKLAGEEAADGFGDLSFRQGLAARSTYLGDPSDPNQPGHASKWLVGGPDNEADVFLTAAADDLDDLDDAVALLKAGAELHDLALLAEQRAATLPDPLRGHEHFGFKDGVSQPGIRGRVSSAAGDFITPRQMRAPDSRSLFFSKPGQVLIWPGQFLLGEPRQDPNSLLTAAAAATNFPSWARRGSYVVVRRLRQDVEAFWEFVASAASEVGQPAQRFAAMLVGRWPSGAPLMRSPTADDAALAGDPWANNHFLFDDDTRPSELRDIPGYEGDRAAQAKADVLGRVCPHFAHIRKANPRDSATDLGKPADTLIRLILRRGIPFGSPLAGIENPSEALREEERGLMFVSYAATIEDQFEFLTRRWANSPVQPNLGGHDPLIGQRDSRGDRKRFIDFPSERGGVRVEIDREWVVATGGGYFFAPPISALRGALGS